MKQFLLIAVFAAGLLHAECGFFDRWSHTTPAEDEDISMCLKGDIDVYLDTVLEKARDELPDPMRLPPRATVVDLTDGVLWGLDDMTRRGNAEVHCQDNDTVIIKSKITTPEIKGRYTWRQERKNKKDREGYVVFISDDFEAELELIIQHKSGETTHPELHRFQINRFKDARIEITGMGYLSWAIGEATTLMSGIFQRAIAHAIQGPFEEALQRHMREINIE